MKAKFFIILFLLSSCASDSADKMAKFRELAINSAMSDSQFDMQSKTTDLQDFQSQISEFSPKQENLLQHHERAKAEWIDLQGNVVKSYSHSERKLGPLAYLPLLSFFLPRNYENYEVIITFNKAAITDIQSLYGIITLESESNCHEAIFSCITRVK